MIHTQGCQQRRVKVVKGASCSTVLGKRRSPSREEVKTWRRVGRHKVEESDGAIEG